MKTRISCCVVVAVFLSFTVGLICLAFAEDRPNGAGKTKDTGVGVDRPKGWDEGKKTGWRGSNVPPGLSRKDRIKELKELKEKDPGAFKEKITEHRRQIKERLENLKETNPEKYKVLMKKRREYRL
ncbi:MAG: hypothetical protein FJZ16_09530, partial [Candidatus Omnitrophica bacterium]|nr:hypothetical protein [Candidatus Omnitrophota bacterium]